MWQVGEVSISELIQQIDSREMALPQFQRPSVWGKANWIPFLMTILQGRPTGTLLLMEVSDQAALAPRPIETAPDLQHGDLRWLLLDGQQRTTTLYKAAKTYFGDAPNTKTVIVNVKAAIDDGQLRDEHLDVVPLGHVSSTSEMARLGKVRLATLLDTAELESWRFSYISEHMRTNPAEFNRRIEAAAPALLRLGGYRFPILQIRSDTPLDVVADIFEGMNRRGQPLNKFDLMVARLYRPMPNGQMFDLRDQWSSCLSAAPYLQRVGIGEEDGLLPLQLIAKQISRLPSKIRGRVRGLTSGDVLELPPEQIIGLPGCLIPALNLGEAVHALEAAASFLVRSCGVVAPSLLPQAAMLLPLADQFLRSPGSRLDDAKLKRWFFAAGLTVDYYGSVNSYADRDCGQLKEWAAPSGPEPASVRALTRSYVEGLDLSQAFTREGNILGKTVMSLLVTVGALDWGPGQLRVSEYDSIDFHHMVPEQRLRVWYPRSPEKRRPIAALTPISAATNRTLGSRNASDVIAELANDATPTMHSHKVDMGLLASAWNSEADFAKFTVDRERQLRNLIISALGL